VRVLERHVERFLPEELDLYFDDIVDATSASGTCSTIQGGRRRARTDERVGDLAPPERGVAGAHGVQRDPAPLTLITGIFGMNTRFPGFDTATASGARSQSASRGRHRRSRRITHGAGFREEKAAHVAVGRAKRFQKCRFRGDVRGCHHQSVDDAERSDGERELPKRPRNRSKTVEDARELLVASSKENVAKPICLIDFPLAARSLGERTRTVIASKKALRITGEKSLQSSG